jgi:tetratricopeptide (TPR) repeat protein
MSLVARLEPLTLPTYPVGDPEKNPVFFEKRVYQGSSGKVYPVPFIDKVYDEPSDVTYQSARLENDFVRLVMLPEIGGRIFLGQDKTNDDYDFFYRQDVIKPALVGLAGPWISGGVEFNWPQHHRPGTFLPADVHIENEPDGAATVWLSEHDPLNRLKGMHGIRLRPDSSLIELRARLYNRTPLTRTFLWWANVAARVHDQYQSFFPPDVNYVADHAVRALSSFPIADNPYYDIDYQNRPGANDLSWYRNIPVPTSYMVCQTLADFFGGYDFEAGGGFVHVANRHIAPGKKQWTWGNAEFGRAWDRELTDHNGPYVELMAGVYTDNQPDFSYLLPYETKTFSQFWWPLRDLGPVQAASESVALRMVVEDDRTLDLGLNVSSRRTGELVVRKDGDVLGRFPFDLAPGQSFRDRSLRLEGENPAALEAEVRASDGRPLLLYRPVDPSTLTRDRPQATEPPPAGEIDSPDELYFTAEHLDQYRHPTRKPEPYLERCLEFDRFDARANLALGKRLLHRGSLAGAADHLERAIARLTSRHPNPVTGEAHYFLGIARRLRGEHDAAYPLFYKATWNYEWRSGGYYQLATLDCRNGDFDRALGHLEASLDTNRQNNKARVLQALALASLPASDGGKARSVLNELLDADPLDHWARHVLTSVTGEGLEAFFERSRNDAQTILDLAFDYAEAGFFRRAIELIETHHARPTPACAVPNPLARTSTTAYALAWLKHAAGADDAAAALETARAGSPDHCFPSRPEEMRVLEWALETAAESDDPLAAYALGNFYYDRERHHDAIRVWQIACRAPNPQAHRNLAIARWNTARDADAAREGYLRAIELDPDDARLVSEYDQLRQKLNDPPEERLRFLEAHRELVLRRDDATVALASLYNLTGRPGDALDLLTSRRFHPWEGGEGAVLRQYTAAHVALGRRALDADDPATALEHFRAATDTPDSLGEKYHPLQAKADIHYWTGRSLRATDRENEAAEAFLASAEEQGDFSEMAVTEFSPLSYFRGLSLRALGRETEAAGLFEALLAHARARLEEPATISYFATSLPNLLVFDEDLKARRNAEAHLLVALARHGLGQPEAAAEAVEQVLAFDRANLDAVMLGRELRSAVR